MTRVLVVSSHVESIAYDPTRYVLEVVYRPDRRGERHVHRWAEIPHDIHFDIMASASKGRALQALASAYGKGRRHATIDADGVETPYHAVLR